MVLKKLLCENENVDSLPVSWKKADVNIQRVAHS